MKKIIPALGLAMALFLSACAAGGEVQPSYEPDPSPTSQVQPTPTPTPEPTPTPYNGPVNPLTGLPTDDEIGSARPIAVMLNNVKQAMPQLGVSQADIIYEAHVEGGATRLVGLFQSVEDVGVIGSVRSARPDFLEIVAGHDAILLHAGGSKEAYKIINSGAITSFDCVKSPLLDRLFWRDKDRLATMSIEHTLVTSGEWIENYVPNTGVRLEHEESFTYTMDFVEDATPADGKQALTVTVPFSNYKTGVFRYDADTGLYLVEQYGQPHIDGNDNTQIAVKNVIVIQTTVDVIDSSGHVAMDLTDGEGWFACGGKIIPIRWSKDSFNDHFVYETMDGQPLSLNAGKSYVNIIPIDNQVTAE